MNDRRHHIRFTKAAREQLSSLNDAFQQRVESELSARRFVPGEDVIEITAADIYELSRRMEIVFLDERQRSFERRRVIIVVYALVGIISILVGLFYQEFADLTASPLRLAFLAGGVLTLMASIVFVLIGGPESRTAYSRVGVGKGLPSPSLAEADRRQELRAEAELLEREPGLGRRIREAVHSRNVAEARVLAEKLPTETFDVDLMILLGYFLATYAVDETGRVLLEHVFSERRSDLTLERLRRILSGVVSYHEQLDNEAEGLGIAQAISDAILSSESADDTVEAWTYNQVSKLQYGAGNYDEAKEYVRRAVELEGSDTSYLHNLAVIEAHFGRLAEATELIEQALELGDRDAYVLSLAVSLYARTGRVEEARELLDELEQIDGYRARVTRMQDDVRKALGDVGVEEVELTK